MGRDSDGVPWALRVPGWDPGGRPVTREPLMEEAVGALGTPPQEWDETTRQYAPGTGL